MTDKKTPTRIQPQELRMLARNNLVRSARFVVVDGNGFELVVEKKNRTLVTPVDTMCEPRKFCTVKALMSFMKKFELEKVSGDFVID